MRVALFAAVLGAASLLAAPGFADVLKFKASLGPQQEVPPHADLKGSGAVEASVDTTNLGMTYHVTFDGLTGDAKAAHFHGAAKPGSNAGVQVPVAGKVFSGMEGKATITADQLKMLEDGTMYFNVHTAANPAGEIRGQMMKE